MLVLCWLLAAANAADAEDRDPVSGVEQPAGQLEAIDPATTGSGEVELPTLQEDDLPAIQEKELPAVRKDRRPAEQGEAPADPNEDRTSPALEEAVTPQLKERVAPRLREQVAPKLREQAAPAPGESRPARERRESLSADMPDVEPGAMDGEAGGAAEGGFGAPESALEGSATAPELDTGARKSITEPVISGYRPAVPGPGDTVRIRGRNLLAGNDAGPYPLRIAGLGYAEQLSVIGRHSSEVRVRLPGDIPPGRYVVGLYEPSASGSGWRSNNDRELQVGRRVRVDLALELRCFLELRDERFGPRVVFTDRDGRAVTVALHFERVEPDTFGARFLHYAGEAILPLDVVTVTSDTRVAVTSYEINSRYPVSELCAEHHRVTLDGHPIDPYESRGPLPLKDQRMRVTRDTELVELRIGFLALNRLARSLPPDAGLPPPTPVDE